MSELVFNEVATVATPGSGKKSIYSDDDGYLYSKDDAGVLRPLENTKSDMIVQAVAHDTALASGVDVSRFPIPLKFNGWNLVDADVMVHTVSTSGMPEFALYNITQTAFMLSTNITVDENEKNSYDAATQPVIDTANDDVATGDEIRIDVIDDGTGTEGCSLMLVWEKP